MDGRPESGYINSETRAFRRLGPEGATPQDTTESARYPPALPIPARQLRRKTKTKPALMKQEVSFEPV